MIDREKILALAAEELADANTKHPPTFSSAHEAYAVLLEEVEEMVNEVEAVKREMLGLWTNIKADLPIEDGFNNIYRRTIYAVQEGIQVIAMCDKATQRYSRKRAEEC